MNPVDFAIIGVVLLSAIFSFARGFVREALSIVAWAGAAYITIVGFDWVFGQVELHVHNPLLSQVIAGFGLFVASLIVLTVITSVIARLVHFTGLTPIDRTLGFIFGLTRGAFLVCVAYLLLVMFVQQDDWPPLIRDARSGPYLQEGAGVLKSFLPENFKVKSADAFDQLFAPSGDLAKKASNALANPTPTATVKSGTAAVPNYPANDRRDLDRVIGTQRLDTTSAPTQR